MEHRRARHIYIGMGLGVALLALGGILLGLRTEFDGFGADWLPQTAEAALIVGGACLTLGIYAMVRLRHGT